MNTISAALDVVYDEPTDHKLPCTVIDTPACSRQLFRDVHVLLYLGHQVRRNAQSWGSRTQGGRLVWVLLNSPVLRSVLS